MPTIWTACISLLVLAAFLTMPHAHSEPNAPMVILKLDDIRRHKNGLHDGWEQTLAYLDEQKIPASLGIICNSLEDAPEAYVDRLKALIDTGRYEFWNHGWSHTLDKEAGTTEFRGTGYEYQSERFARSQDIVKQALGVTLHGFGAPYNATDADTARVVGEHPDMAWWMYAPQGAVVPNHITLLQPTPGAGLERPVHVPNPDILIEGFETYRNQPLIVLQGHPASWSQDNRMEDFKTVIRFLQEHGYKFVLPTDYVNSLGKPSATSNE